MFQLCLDHSPFFLMPLSPLIFFLKFSLHIPFKDTLEIWILLFVSLYTDLTLKFFTMWISFYNLILCRIYFDHSSRHFQILAWTFPHFKICICPCFWDSPHSWFSYFLTYSRISLSSFSSTWFLSVRVYQDPALFSCHCRFLLTVSSVSRTSVSNFVWLSSWQLQSLLGPPDPFI